MKLFFSVIAVRCCLLINTRLIFVKHFARFYREFKFFEGMDSHRLEATLIDFLNSEFSSLNVYCVDICRSCVFMMLPFNLFSFFWMKMYMGSNFQLFARRKVLTCYSSFLSVVFEYAAWLDDWQSLIKQHFIKKICMYNVNFKIHLWRIFWFRVFKWKARECLWKILILRT